MELNCTDIVQVILEREEALLALQAPSLDIKVVASGYEHRLVRVEVDTSHWACSNKKPRYALGGGSSYLCDPRTCRLVSPGGNSRAARHLYEVKK